MTSTLIPSSGEMRPGPYLNLNRLGLKGGERVLFEETFGRPEIGTVELVAGNRINIAPCAAEGQKGGSIFMTAVKHKLRLIACPDTRRPAEADLLAALTARHAAAPHLYDGDRAGIVRAWHRWQREAGR